MTTFDAILPALAGILKSYEASIKPYLPLIVNRNVYGCIVLIIDACHEESLDFISDGSEIRQLTAEICEPVDPELFRSHGIDPVYCKIVVVKSPNGFRAAYAPIAKAMFVVDTPGVSTANLRTLPFRRVPRPIYPLDRDIARPDGL